MWCFLLIFLLFQNGLCALWQNGIVHYAINRGHYDDNSQDLIKSTLADIENLLCLRFFEVKDDFDSNATRLLYINNPSRRQDCPPDVYDYKKTIVDMPIGYKCLHKKGIARIVTDMLIASIDDSVPTINSYDLIRKFQEQDDPGSQLINRKSRNYINGRYHNECSSLPLVSGVRRASTSAISLSADNEMYYKDKIWPLGIVMYGVDQRFESTPQLAHLQRAMAAIQRASCIVFQPIGDLKPNNYIWFGENGDEMPNLGFKEGKQSVSLQSMVTGAVGHSAHTLLQLMRSLGVAMMSNRPDRDNYINVRWDHVERGKQQYLEKSPYSSWIRDVRLPYDYRSVTHAPANFACADCRHGEATVEPAHDNLWQRILSMGRTTELSEGDKTILNLLYSAQCQNRYANK